MSFPNKSSIFKFGKPFHNPPISLRPLHRKSNDKMRGKLFARRAYSLSIGPPRWTDPAAGTILDLRRSTSRTTPVWMIIHGGHPNL